MKQLYYGDCLEIMDQLIVSGVKVDAIITDPPYEVTACKWDTVIPFDEMWPRLKKLRKDKTPVLLFGAEPYSSALRLSNIKERKYDWVWDKVLKTGHLNASRMPMGQHENITVFGKGTTNYYPIMENGKPQHGEGKKQKDQNTNIRYSENYGSESNNYKEKKGNTLKYPSTMSIKIQKVHPSKCVHPTQKPVALMEYLVKTYTKEGDTVLDFTCGSGSTGVACNNLNRNFIGIDNGYCEKEGQFKGWKWVDVTRWRIGNEGKQKELF